MGRPSKPMAKNSNSKYTPRNNKSDIFSKFSQKAEAKVEAEAQKESKVEEKPDMHKESGDSDKAGEEQSK